MISASELSEKEYLTIKIGDTKYCIPVPRPELNYGAFGRVKPAINFKPNVLDREIDPDRHGKHLSLEDRLYKAEDDAARETILSEHGLTSDLFEKFGDISYGHYCSQLIQEITPSAPENTLYIGIRKSAGRNKVLKEVEAILRKREVRATTKMRDDKWKYYLIVYDLKTEDWKLSWDMISEILASVYPDVTIVKKRAGKRHEEVPIEGAQFFKPRTCLSFYDAAVKLINGDYLKYI